MTKNTRKKTEITNRRQIVAEKYLRGMFQSQIAEELGVDTATVSRDLKILREEWLQSALVDLNDAKAKELAKIDQLEVTYWSAWERGLGEFKSKTVKGRGASENQKPSLLEQILKTEDRNGDPRYLAGIQWCINKRCEILGLDAPKENKLSGSVEITRKHDLSKLSDDELRAWDALMSKTQNEQS
jgi:DNA-binding MarR family transcriptional regulator